VVGIGIAVVVAIVVVVVVAIVVGIGIAIAIGIAVGIAVGIVTIYDQVHALPRMHRLALAGWILRTNNAGYEERQRVIGRLPRIERKRETEELNNTEDSP
jgi:hypothetical protein